MYLDSFPPGTNLLYRERREYDCSCCKQFVTKFSNVVAVRNGKLMTVWDIENASDTYQQVANILSEYIKSHSITSAFFHRDDHIGSAIMLEQAVDNEVITWNHLFVDIPQQFVMKSDSIPTRLAKVRNTNIMLRSMLTEITEEAIAIVCELIAPNSLYWKLQVQ